MTRDGKKVLVTGASSGIGAAVAERSTGSAVTTTGRRADQQRRVRRRGFGRGTKPAEVRRQFETNVLGLLGVTRAAVPGMRRRGAGRVVNIFTEAIRRYAVDQFEGGADPRELAELLVDVVESRRPRTRYLFPTSSRLLVGTFAGVPDRLADALKLRAAGVRR
jgi:NAD(P)-dependent dehydrogenase (short-subunit alcohol dehydrogenase family)